MSRDRGAECRVESCSEEPVSTSGYCLSHLLDQADNTAVTDEMIGAASIPNAAALLKRAASQGLISPTSEYATFAARP